jgi:hypothetical protein
MAEYDIGGIMQQVHNAAAHMSADGYLHGMRVEPVAVETQSKSWIDDNAATTDCHGTAQSAHPERLSGNDLNVLHCFGASILNASGKRWNGPLGRQI